MSESLGGKIGTYGIDRRFLFQQFVTWGVIAYVLIFGIILHFPPAPSVAGLFMWLALYLVTVIAWDMVHPVIVLYDNGVMVVEGSKRSTWRWHELSHLDGTRHSYSVNGIPLARWGANQFYTFEGEAFRVGAWTADANALVDFILMKMSELRIPGEIERIKSGALLSYGKTHVNDQGIEKNGQHYPWSAIRRLRFQYWTETAITLVLKNGKSVRLDSMEGLAFYSFVGVFDRYMGSKYSHEIQQDRIQFRRRMKHHYLNLLKLARVVVIMGIVALTVTVLIMGIIVIGNLAQ